MNNIKTASLVNQEGGAVLLEGIKIDGDVRGLLFDARVIQTYRNNTSSAIEAIYNFPLPFGAVLLGVDVNLGSAALTGVVVKRADAVDSYEDMVSSGDSAILIERTSDGNYCMNLGNLVSGEMCVVQIRYGQILRYEQGGLRLQIPTALATRYGDAIASGQFEPHQEYRSHLTALYSFELSLRLHDQLIHTRISSPSHAISLMHHPKNEISNSAEYTEIRLGKDAELDRDFVLSMAEIKQESLSVQSPDYVCAKQNVALVSFRAETTQYEHKKVDLPLSLKILVDCSGSMAGDSIESVADALRFLLNELRPHDRFSLSKFGRLVEHRSRSLWSVGEASLSAAHFWVNSLQADMGGTELERALKSAIEQAKHKPSDILLITDGAIHAIESVIETARAGRQRIFVIGIGSSPVESHLRRLAIATTGACEFIAPRESVKSALLKILNRVRHPTYENLRVTWPEGTDIKYQTSINHAVCNGDAVNVFAWTTSAVSGEVVLVGTQSGSSDEQILSKVQLRDVRNSDAVSRLGADERMKSEEVQGSDLALTYQLISDETSMLIEHIRPADQRPREIPALHKIAQMVPAGWGGAGSVKDVVRYMRLPSDRLVSFSEASAQEASFGDKILKELFSTQKPAHINIPAATKDNQTGIAEEKKKRRIKVTDRENPTLWSGVDDDQGLTPMGFSMWLAVNDGLYLPDSFEFLDLIGVPKSVVDWLDLHFIDERGHTLDEKIAVEGLVRVMRNPKTLDYLSGMISLEDWSCAVTGCIKKMDLIDYSDEVTARVIASFLERLKEMNATCWPKSANCLNKKL